MHAPEFAYPPSVFDPLLSSATAWNALACGSAPRSYVEALAGVRLAHLIERARADSALYRERLRGLDARRPTALSELPPVTKRELMERFDEWCTDRALTRRTVECFIADPARAGEPLHDRYVVWTSSGTSGEPGIFVQDAQALAVYDALEWVRFRPIGAADSALHALDYAARYAFIAATGAHFAGIAMVERLRRLNPWIAESTRVFSVLQPLARLVAELNAFRPDVVATYPSAAGLLAEEQRAGRLHVALRELWTGGEGSTPQMRQHIGAAFGCRVRETYGASEAFSIAAPCEHGTLHVNSDWVVVEPVDRLYRPSPPGELSHTTLVTNLANQTQPLIRYDLGDRTMWLDVPCPCGSPFPALRVEGRSDDVLELEDGAGRTAKLLPLAVETVLETSGGIYRFQVVRTSAASLALRVSAQRSQTARAQQRARRALVSYLKAQGLDNVRVDLDVRPIQCGPGSGKLHRVVSAPEPVPASSRAGQPARIRTGDTPSGLANDA